MTGPPLPALGTRVRCQRAVVWLRLDELVPRRPLRPATEPRERRKPAPAPPGTPRVYRRSRSLLRSFAVVPPHTPTSSGRSRANARHSERASHSEHVAWARRCPMPNLGTNRSTPSPRQAASACHAGRRSSPARSSAGSTSRNVPGCISASITSTGIGSAIATPRRYGPAPSSGWNIGSAVAHFGAISHKMSQVGRTMGAPKEVR